MQQYAANTDTKYT